MNTIFSFGEKVPEYDMKVLNEREVRASAGILFLFAMISFLNSWLIGDFTITKIFVVIFLIDFSIRVLINPKYAPTLIIGRFFVRHQKVEYIGAPQKRFAWLIGLVLAVIMFYLIVLNNVIGPFNLLVCLICLTLLFFEAAFGICIGCKIYNVFHKEKAKLCPGNSCEINKREAIQTISPIQMLLVAVFLGLIYTVANSALIKPQQNSHPDSAEKKDCTAPDWAVAMGHKEKWELHHGCNKSAIKPSETPASVVATPVSAPKAKTTKDCVAPDWAVAMGHKEKWELHYGCKSDTKTTEVNAPTPVETTPLPTSKTTQKSNKAEDCVAPDWAVEMGHKEMWKQHNCQ